MTRQLLDITFAAVFNASVIKACTKLIYQHFLLARIRKLHKSVLKDQCVASSADSSDLLRLACRLSYNKLVVLSSTNAFCPLDALAMHLS